MPNELSEPHLTPVLQNLTEALWLLELAGVPQHSSRIPVAVRDKYVDLKLKAPGGILLLPGVLYPELTTWPILAKHLLTL